MCEVCWERLPAIVVDKIHAFYEKWPNSEFGPAHVVIADYNAEPDHVQWCLDHFDEYTHDHPTEELNATRAFLHDLMEFWRTPEPMEAETPMPE